MRRIAISVRRITIGLLGGVFLLECLWAALVVGLPVVNQHFSGDPTRAVTVTGQCERDRYVVAVVVRHMYRCPARWTVSSSYGGESWEAEGEVQSARELAPGDVVHATAGGAPPIVPITGFTLWVGYVSLLGALVIIIGGVVAGIRSGSDGSGGGGNGTEGGSCGGGGGD
jgi:hypothetical protein